MHVLHCPLSPRAHSLIPHVPLQAGSALSRAGSGSMRVPAGLEAYALPASTRSGQQASWHAAGALTGGSADGAVECAYSLAPAGQAAPAGGSALGIRGMLFRPVGSGAQPSVGGAPAQAEQQALAYFLSWQVSACQPPAQAQAQGRSPVAGSIQWQMGSDRRLVQRPGDAGADLEAVASSLRAVQQATAAPARPPVTLHTHLIMPGIKKSSAAYAAVAGLLKVAAQESSGQQFSHLIHDGYSAAEARPPSGAGDMFGLVVSQSVVVQPRILAIPPEYTALGASMTPRSGAFAGSVVITGGLSDIGQLTAHWVAETAPAAHIWLVSRSGRAGKPTRLPAVQAGCISCAAFDVASTSDMAGLTACMAARAAPAATAVFHAGAVLRDAVLSRQTVQVGRSERAACTLAGGRGCQRTWAGSGSVLCAPRAPLLQTLRAVYAPKVDGALQLLAHTHGQPLINTMYFSSLTAQASLAQRLSTAQRCCGTRRAPPPNPGSPPRSAPAAGHPGAEQLRRRQRGAGELGPGAAEQRAACHQRDVGPLGQRHGAQRPQHPAPL